MRAGGEEGGGRGGIINKQKQQEERGKKKKKESEKETAVLREAWPMCSLFKPQNLRAAARRGERAQTISANTNMGNGSKMEFTRARCSARSGQENSQPKSGRPEWQQRGGSAFLLQSIGPPRPGGRSEGSAGQEAAPHRGDTVCSLSAARRRNRIEETGRQ